MRARSNATPRDLRSDYKAHQKAQEDQQELWTYYVVRPASFYPTALLLRLGISANEATWIAMATLLLGCLLLAAGSYGCSIAGALLVNAWLVLDCCDGNMARFLRSASAYGAFLDALGGYMAYALLFFALGVGAFFHPENLLLSRASDVTPEVWGSAVLLLGAWSSLASVWARLVFQKFRNSFGDTELKRHDFTDARLAGARILTIGNNLLNVSGILPVVVFLAVACRAIDLLLLVACAGNTAILLLVARRLLRRAASHGGGAPVD
jgi:phosphatidylglycerophosphate synthase